MKSGSGEQAEDLKNDIAKLKESVVKSIENVHQGKRSLGNVLGDHSTSFVVPMKKQSRK